MALVALREPAFRRLWAAAIVSNTGSWMQTVTAPYVVFEATGSAVWVGAVAFALFFPTVVVAPLAGPLVDRFPRRPIVIGAQIAQMAAAIGLWVLYDVADAGPAALVAMLTVSGTAGGINIIAWQTYVPSLVPPEALGSAVRLNSLQFTAARAAGPALSGPVLVTAGAGAAFLFNAATFTLVLLALRAAPREGYRGTRSGTSLGQDFASGVAYLWRRRSLRLCMGVVAVLGLFPIAITQQAPAIADALDLADLGYGALVSAYGLGTITGSLAAAAVGDRVGSLRLILLGLSVSAVSAVWLAAAGPAAALAAMGALGVATPLAQVTINTAVQTAVAEHYRGRIMSLSLTILSAAMPLGTLALGAAAGWFGLTASIVTAGLATGAAGLAFAASHPALPDRRSVSGPPDRTAVAAAVPLQEAR